MSASREVPMPEADGHISGRTVEGFGVRVDAVRMDTAIRYGDAREAAGYARGLNVAITLCEGMEGWKEATIAWEVCASIHREYAKKKDPFFTTRQSDFVKHAEAARAKALTPAPGKDDK